MKNCICKGEITHPDALHSKDACEVSYPRKETSYTGPTGISLKDNTAGDDR